MTTTKVKIENLEIVNSEIKNCEKGGLSLKKTNVIIDLGNGREI